MSEHYDFHYQPTGSGAISGQQVLEQTEDAINELGDYVNDNVGGAMDVAQQALETAQNAEQDAQTALDTANSFSSAIQSAQQDASTALSTAQTAQTTASNANNTATQAQQDANTAVTTANNASGQVSTLSGTVTTLGQRVTTAEGNIGQNTSDITALTTRVGTAEGNITTLQNDVTIAQGNASSAMATAGQVKQQAYVFRYSSTALTASSTNSNALLDNTDNLKVGDKVIDSSGVLFSITAIDTANSTFTIGTALIDLAQDSDVVHKSGNETINGAKSFNDKMNLLNAVRGIDITSQTIDCNNLTSNASGDIKLYRCTSIVGASNISNIPLQTSFLLIVLQTKYSGASDTRAIQKFYDVGSSSQPISYTRALYNGTWSNWIKDTDKFVTTDTVQTISGSKTFDSNTYVYNSDNTAATPYLFFKNSKTSKGSTSEIGSQLVRFVDKNNNSLCDLESILTSTGSCELRLKSNTLDSNNQNVQTGVTLISSTNGSKRFCPTSNGNVLLGDNNLRWSDVKTNKINALEPSSLSLPVAPSSTSYVDISSYITVLDSSSANTYTPPSNGYITFSVTGNLVQIFHDYGLQGKWSVQAGNTNRGFIPVLGGFEVKIYVTASSVDKFWFIPCQGNV